MQHRQAFSEHCVPLLLQRRLLDFPLGAGTLDAGHPAPLLVVAVFLLEIAQEVLHIDRVARVTLDALQKHLGGVVVIPFRRRFGTVLKRRLQPLTLGGRNRLATFGLRSVVFGHLLVVVAQGMQSREPSADAPRRTSPEHLIQL
ncbi:MAG: hypothetical protein R3C10_19285 [Pirellulales bacterium]